MIIKSKTELLEFLNNIFYKLRVLRDQATVLNNKEMQDQIHEKIERLLILMNRARKISPIELEAFCRLHATFLD